MSIRMTARTCGFAILALAALVTLPGLAPIAYAAEDGFVPLFNGEDLTGWNGDPRLWKVENGEIVGSTDGVTIEHNTFLSTKKEFGDFVLRAKVKLRNHNSGIQFRSEQMPDYVVGGYQADIAEATYYGMLYEEKKRGIMEYWKAMSPEQQAETQTWVKKDDWNQYEITCKGDHITLVLNGHTTCDIVDPEGAKKGIIALQLHAGPEMEVRFKDIEIKDLSSDKQALLLPDIDKTRRERIGARGERFVTPSGFRVEQVATNELTGSLINMSFDHLGRPAVALEREGIALLLDEDDDGQYESKTIFADQIKTVMGMFYLGPGDMLVQSDGPRGPGIYRVTDTNGDDVADKVDRIVKATYGMGEHAPHAIVIGPDGYFYVMYGNHSYPDKKLNQDSPSRGLEEDFLLPRFVDPRGHANKIRAPGGTIQRLDPAMEDLAQISGGFRNAYDFSITADGELLTFDSDMEWDFGLPWYREIRVIHAVPGGDYGWRTGSSKMPDYYVDTLPPIDDVGRGSPVGTCLYQHTAYPKRFHGAFFMGDWSRGRIRVLFPERNGATFHGKTMDFLVGEPLNVTDLDVGPDGMLYFSVGGRGTEGGLYRVVYEGPIDEPASNEGILHVLDQPMPRSAWGRFAIEQARESMGNAWERDLVHAARDPELPAVRRIRALEALQVHGPKPERRLLESLAEDADPEVRAFAVYLLGAQTWDDASKPLTAALDDDHPLVARRACEALVRAGLDATRPFGVDDELVQGLFKLLNSRDRFTRYAARLAIERVNRDVWAPLVLEDSIETRPHGALEGLLALIRTQEISSDADAVFAKLEAYARADMSDEVLLEFLRVTGLAFIRNADSDRTAFKNAVGPILLARFPTLSASLNRELQVVLAYMETPGTVAALLAYLTPDKSQQEQIHTVYALRAIHTGWNTEQRTRLVDWFDRGREMTGAASMEGYINNLWASSMEILPGDERKVAEARKDAALKKRAEDALALLEQIEGDAPKGASDLAQMSFAELSEYLEYDPMSYPGGDVIEQGKNVFLKSRCANCHVFGSIGKGGGPDLSTVVSRFRRRDILEAIMSPSKVISDQYIGVDIYLNDLSTVTGMVASENETSLTVITVDGERMEVPRDSIDEIKASDSSIMPEGLLNTMSLGELVALINFLERGSDI